jgi:CheY-like chemotaxis protein
VLTNDVDVFEVVEELRADPRTAPTPIIVLTSEAMPAESKQRLHGQIDRMARRNDLDRRMLTDLVGSLTEPRARVEGRWQAR